MKTKLIFIAMIFFSMAFLHYSPISNAATNVQNYSSSSNISSSSSAASINGTSTGQEVVNYFRVVFQSDWSRGVAYNPSVDGMGYAQSTKAYGSGYQPFNPEDVSGNMTISPILSPDSSENAILGLINSANTSLLIEQLYIYSSLTDILSAIVSAENRGVNCCVIVDSGSSESNASAYQLTQAGVQVKICTGNVPMYFDTMHNKGVLVDGKITLVSSINWSPTSLRNNREAGLIIQSKTVTSYYTMLYDHDWDVCVDYNPSTSFASATPTAPSPAESSSISASTLNPLESASSSYTDEFSTVENFTGNISATLMSSPDNCFDVVTNLLQTAKSSIDVSVYTLSSGQILDILSHKIADGVKVRLLLEKYQVDSYEKNYNRWTLYNLTVLGAPSSSDPNTNNTAQGLWADPAFTFQHCKYAIIDNSTLILSSGNWARESCPPPTSTGSVDGNRDWWIAIYGNNASSYVSNPNSNSSSNNNLIPVNLLSIGAASPIYFIGAIAVGALIIVIKKRVQEREIRS